MSSKIGPGGAGGGGGAGALLCQLFIGGRVYISLGAGGAGWLGQHQLRSLGVQYLSAMPKQLVAFDGLLEWLHDLATIRSQCSRGGLEL